MGTVERMKPCLFLVWGPAPCSGITPGGSRTAGVREEPGSAGMHPPCCTALLPLLEKAKGQVWVGATRGCVPLGGGVSVSRGGGEVALMGSVSQEPGQRDQETDGQTDRGRDPQLKQLGVAVPRNKHRVCEGIQEKVLEDARKEAKGMYSFGGTAGTRRTAESVRGEELGGEGAVRKRRGGVALHTRAGSPSV